jgi:2-C-methyl-D-erythritol 4-phosphate cytidylyltransferase
MKVIAIIVAAGSGTRMKNLSEPKQFVNVNDKPLLLYSLETFANCDEIAGLTIVTNKEYFERVHNIINNNNKIKEKLASIVAGGNTRQESVLNGLRATLDQFDENSVVLIHDAARPLISEEIIKENIKAVKEVGAAVTVLPASDTLLVSQDKENISSSLKRDEIYQAQTPQSFILKDIYQAHLLAKKDNLNATDDASIFKKYNQKPLRMVNGDKRNFKVTTEEDLLILNNYLNN